jgi:hypothetical protein
MAHQNNAVHRPSAAFCPGNRPNQITVNCNNDNTTEEPSIAKEPLTMNQLTMSVRQRVNGEPNNQRREYQTPSGLEAGVGCNKECAMATHQRLLNKPRQPNRLGGYKANRIERTKRNKAGVVPQSATGVECQRTAFNRRIATAGSR